MNPREGRRIRVPELPHYLKCFFNSNNYNNNKTGSMQRNKRRRLIHKANNRNYSLGSPDIELIRQIF